MVNVKNVHLEVLHLILEQNSVVLVLVVCNLTLLEEHVNFVHLEVSQLEVLSVNLVLLEKYLPMEVLAVVYLVVLEWKLIQLLLNVFSVNLDTFLLQMVNVNNVQKDPLHQKLEQKNVISVHVVLNPIRIELNVNSVVMENILLVMEVTVNYVL